MRIFRVNGGHLREKRQRICNCSLLSSARRANTPWTTRSQRTPINGNALFAFVLTHAKNQPRAIARPRCNRTFTLCSVRLSVAAVSEVLSSSTSRNMTTVRYCSGRSRSASSRSPPSSAREALCSVEMHGKGTFFDPRLNDAAQFPVAAAAGFGNLRNTPDLITPKLADLQFY